MLRSEARRAFRVRALRLPLMLTLMSALGACAGLRGVMVPVSGTVAGATQVDMLVATTRKRADPAEMFSGDRGPTRGRSARCSGHDRCRAIRPRSSSPSRPT
jgi:hypothetical protein